MDFSTLSPGLRDPVRLAGICAIVALLWIVGASQVHNGDKLALSAIVPGAVMTQPFGCSNLVLEPFDPNCPSRHVHTGVDLAAVEGAPVHAASGGTAMVGFDQRGAGLYVVVAAGAHVRVLYCHLSLALVSGRQEVTAGELIGKIGSTGLATGPHLHFEVQVDGRSVDPVAWLDS